MIEFTLSMIIQATTDYSLLDLDQQCFLDLRTKRITGVDEVDPYLVARKLLSESFTLARQHDPRLMEVMRGNTMSDSDSNAEALSEYLFGNNRHRPYIPYAVVYGFVGQARIWPNTQWFNPFEVIQRGIKTCYKDADQVTNVTLFFGKVPQRVYEVMHENLRKKGARNVAFLSISTVVQNFILNNRTPVMQVPIITDTNGQNLEELLEMFSRIKLAEFSLDSNEHYF